MSALEPLADVVVTTISMGQPMSAAANALTLEQGMEVSDLVAARLERPLGGLAGYKIAWNTQTLMEAFNMPHPGLGRVFQKYNRATGADIALSDFHEMMIEVEIVAFLGRDLAPGEDHTAQSVKEAVDRFTVGFEILDRYQGAKEASAPSIIAHNVFNAGAVLGDITIPADELDVSGITTRLTHDGNVVFEDVGKAPQDPFEAIAFLAGHFTGRGETMKAGSLILCGSHIPLYPVEEPGSFSVSMSALGEASFSVL